MAPVVASLVSSSITVLDLVTLACPSTPLLASMPVLEIEEVPARGLALAFLSWRTSLLRRSMRSAPGITVPSVSARRTAPPRFVRAAAWL